LRILYTMYIFPCNSHHVSNEHFKFHKVV